MKKFVFRLSTVLKVREKEEDEAKKELAKTIKEVEVLSDKIQSYYQERIKIGDDYKELVQLGYVEEFGNCLYYLQNLSEKISGLEEELMKLQNVLAKKRSLLMEARKKVQSLLTLKDKQYSRWKKEQQRFEAKVIDEVATNRYIKLEKERNNEK